MDGEGCFSIIIGIAVRAYFFGISGENHRYQVANYSSSQTIVLDTKTGEAWISASKKYAYGGEIPVLRPIQYEGKQSENKDYGVYTAEETRNKNNSSWWTFFK
jgi:hypothetical protein